MKKVFSILIILFLFTGVVSAGNNDLGVQGPFNFIQTRILEYTLARVIRKNVGGRIKIKLTSYGTKALINGVFKSAVFEGKNINIDGISISRVYVETVTENNRIDLSDLSNIRLISDITARYTAEITNEDINIILSSEKYKTELNRVNKKLAPFLRIHSTNIYSQNNRLHVKLFIVSDLTGISFTVSFSTGISPQENKTGFNDIKLNRLVNTGVWRKIIKYMDILNPINFVIKELDDAKISAIVKSVNIIDDKIQISGIIKLYKDKK